MKMPKPTVTAVIISLLAITGNGQTPPAPAPAAAAPAKPVPAKPAAARPAAPRAVSPVDNVITLVKSGMSEAFIIKTLQKNNKPQALTPADLVKLKQAGVSENLMNVMMDPSAAPAPTPAPVAPAPVVAAAPAAPVAPVAAPVSFPTSAPVVDLNAQKKRVVVDPFDDGAVQTAVQAAFHTRQNIGKGIQAMLVTRLAKSGKVVIVDRSRVKETMAEQDFTAGGRVKQGTGARIGRISGADAILAGDIIIFGRDDKKKSGAAAGYGAFCRLCGVVAGSHKEEKAVVAISYRVIDAETTEIIATGEARGESVRKSNDFFGAMARAYTGAGAVAIDMSSTNFAETIIGEATQDCVNKLAAIMDEQAAAMKKRVREVDAYVADLSGNSMVVSAGSSEGVTVGEVFEILKVIRDVKDPVTQETLDRVTEKEGEMVVTSVRDKIATGTYTGAPAKVKDIARKKLPPQQ